MSSKTSSNGKSSKPPSTYSDKDMEIHREYMKKYKMQSSDLNKQPMKYRDHYQILDVARDATHSEVRFHTLITTSSFGPCADTLALSLVRSVDPPGVPQARAQVPSGPQQLRRGAGAMGRRPRCVSLSLAPARLTDLSIATQRAHSHCLAISLYRSPSHTAAYAVISNPNDRAEYDATLETRDALVEFYKTYNPAKLDNATIQTIIDGWYGREVELFQMLNAKYEIAPHQGTNRALKRAPPTLSHERAQAVARDSLSFQDKQGIVHGLTWTESIGSAVCCKGVLGRLFSKSYYEVETTSPGFVVDHGPSNTPGQGVQMTMQSPAIPATGVASPDVAKPSDSDRLSSATTGVDDDADARASCSTTPPSSTSSSAELPAVVTPTGSVRSSSSESVRPAAAS